MSRQRMIHPDFFIDEDVAMLSPWARLLLLSLLTQADREGRLEDRPARIRVRAFPHDRDVDVDGHLSELREQGFSHHYTAECRKYIQIRNFLKFQKPHPKEAASVIPAPPRRAVESSGEPGNRMDEPANFAGVGIRNTESESKPESTEQADTRTRPANPLVDRGKLVSEGYELIKAIEALENRDPAEILNEASKWRGRGYVRLDTMPDDRMAHTLNTLRAWHRRLTGQAEPTLPAARAAPTLSPLTEKLVGTMREIREREASRAAGPAAAVEPGELHGGADRHRLAPPKAS